METQQHTHTHTHTHTWSDSNEPERQRVIPAAVPSPRMCVTQCRLGQTITLTRATRPLTATIRLTAVLRGEGRREGAVGERARPHVSMYSRLCTATFM